MKALDKYFGRLGNRLFQLSSLYGMFRDGIIPDIYLQDYRNFDNYKYDLQQMLGEDIVRSDYVSIHVRRGKNPSNPNEPNYSENPFYARLDEDYYRRAMAQFPNEKFLVFTDDLAWVENQEMFKDCEKSFQDELTDWNKMAGCKGHIIANSSYSFMAAYIGGGKTIAPNKWFANGERIPYPPEWIIV